jgi:hypothetical protein
VDKRYVAVTAVILIGLFMIAIQWHGAEGWVLVVAAGGVGWGMWDIDHDGGQPEDRR